MTLYKLPSTFVEARRNLIVNPATVGTAGWSAVAAGGSGHSVSLGNQGADVRTTLTASGSPSDGFWALSSSRMPLDAGLPLLSFRGRVRTEAGAAFKVRFSFYQSDGTTFVANVESDYFMSPTTSYMWARLEGVTIPPGAAQVSILLIRYGGEAGDFVGGYQFIAEQASVAGGYFDGSSDDTAAVEHWWAGAANASASIMGVPSAADTIEPVMTLAPYTARREAGTIVHRLLEDSQARFTWRQPNLPVGVFEFLFDGHAAAYAALNKLSARTAWALVDDADDGPIERWFMIADGDIEMQQSDDVAGAYVLRVPYVEVDSI